GSDGIAINGTGALVTHTIQSNWIGVAAAALTNLGNMGWGINILNASNIQIGPAEPSIKLVGANVIGFNGSGGVQVAGPTAKNVQIRGNSIVNNTTIGIALTSGANAMVGVTSVPPPTLSVDHAGPPIIISGQANAALTDCIATGACRVDVYL